MIWQVTCYTLLSGFQLLWPPTLGCNPKQPDSPKRSHVPQSVTPMHGAITLSGTPFLGNFGRTAAVMALLQTTIRQHESSGWHMPYTSQGDCACHSTGAGLHTASHEATATVCNSFTHILLCTVNQFEGKVPATAATSSLGRLADPDLDRWHSTLLPCTLEITGATSLQSCLAPVPHTDGTYND